MCALLLLFSSFGVRRLRHTSSHTGNYLTIFLFTFASFGWWCSAPHTIISYFLLISFVTTAFAAVVISLALLASLLSSDPDFNSHFTSHFASIHIQEIWLFNLCFIHIPRTGFCELLASWLVNILSHALLMITGAALLSLYRLSNRQENEWPFEPAQKLRNEQKITQ